MAFADMLAALPAVEHIASLELTAADGRNEAIENCAGSQGSLRVYAYLAGKYGVIDAAAAREGLALYAEHVEDARRHPGKHPNIDRLLTVLEGGGSYAVRLVKL